MNRSRAKGPEPEGVAVATISGRRYAFVSLERVGGVMVYDVTTPASPKFVDYKNSRSTSAYAGDHGAEALIFIVDSTGPNGKSHVVVANKISGTLTIFEVVNNKARTSAAGGPGTRAPTFNVFPDPVNTATLYFNRAADVEVTNVQGAVQFRGIGTLTPDVNNHVPGVCFVRTGNGATVRFVVAK